MLTNWQIKKRELFALNEKKINALKQLRIAEKELLIAYQSDIKFIRQTGKSPVNRHSKQALNNYIDTYNLVLQIEEDITKLQNWSADELRCY